MGMADKKGIKTPHCAYKAHSFGFFLYYWRSLSIFQNIPNVSRNSPSPNPQVAGSVRRDLNQHNDVLMCSNPQIGSFPPRVCKYIVYALN